MVGGAGSCGLKREEAFACPCQGDALCLTADHGVIDVPQHGHIYLDEISVDWSKVTSVGGDPRVNFIYLNPEESAAEFRSQLEANLGDSVVVFGPQEAVAAGLYGPNVGEPALQRMPDIFALAVKKVALYHRDFAPAKSVQMIGQHGGLSPQEMSIPLLAWGAFGSR